MNTSINHEIDMTKIWQKQDINMTWIAGVQEIDIV